MAAVVRVVGLNEARMFFNQLPLQFTDRVLKAAGRAASEPVRIQASIEAPLGPAKQRQRAKKGARLIPLKQSIKTVSGGSPKRTGELGLVRTGALRRNPYRAYHARFVEFGTKPRKAGGWYAKINPDGITLMTKKPFMGPAIEKKGYLVERYYLDFVDKKTVALMKRLLRKGVIQ